MPQDDKHKLSMPEDDDVLEAAARWHMRLSADETLLDDPEFLDWLAQSDAHVDALVKARAAWGALGDYAAAPEIVMARRDALARSTKIAQARWKSWKDWRKPIWKPVAAVAVAATAVGGVMLSNGFQFNIGEVGPPIVAEVPRNIFETEIGETRVVTLADNSKVSLDASTKLAVNLTPTTRDIELLQGQAHFDVAKDAGRPFRVKAGDQTVVATGTAFNVEMVGFDVLVTLIEGEVIVTDGGDLDGAPLLDPSQSPAAGLIVERIKTRTLKPGQQLIASRSSETQISEDADINKATSWRRGKLIFEDDRLSAAVERMNRYSKITIQVDGETLDTLGVSGVFNAGDTDAFVEAIEAYFPVEAHRVSPSLIVLQRGG